MRNIVLFVLLVFLAPFVQGVVFDDLSFNVISDVSRLDIAREYGSVFRSVVVGYDASPSDYLAAAQLAIALTAMNTHVHDVTLSCSQGTQQVRLFTPVEREVVLMTDQDPIRGPSVIVGGPLTNRFVRADAGSQLLAPGDVIVLRQGFDVVVAGYTALDTQKAVSEVIALLR